MEQQKITINMGGIEHVLKADQPLSIQIMKIMKDYLIIFVIRVELDFVSKHMLNKPIWKNKHYHLILYDIIYNMLVLVLFNRMLIYHFLAVHVVIFAIVVI